MKLRDHVYFIFTKHLFSKLKWLFLSKKKKREITLKQQELAEMRLQQLTKSTKL